MPQPRDIPAVVEIGYPVTKAGEIVLAKIEATSARNPTFRLLRPQQWIKNAFVAAPLFFSPDVLEFSTSLRVALGVVCFCALSSAVYILNDYMDREADRAHPLKCSRPLADGSVSVTVALTLMGILAGCSMVVALAITPGFAVVLSIYLCSNLLYSLWLKHVSIVDVLLIAAGFLLRVVGGAILAGVSTSVWILIMTGLLALFLALAKRRDDLVLSLAYAQRGSLRGYNKQFLDASVVMVMTALMVAYLIYTTDREVIERFATEHLVVTAVFVVAGILRYLQIVLVEERSGSPTALALSDRFLVLAIVGWIATFGGLIYF